MHPTPPPVAAKAPPVIAVPLIAVVMVDVPATAALCTTPTLSTLPRNGARTKAGAGVPPICAVKAITCASLRG
jgi:hypothetical protein